jgi:hypothetical protein
MYWGTEYEEIATEVYQECRSSCVPKMKRLGSVLQALLVFYVLVQIVSIACALLIYELMSLSANVFRKRLMEKSGELLVKISNWSWAAA